MQDILNFAMSHYFEIFVSISFSIATVMSVRDLFSKNSKILQNLEESSKNPSKTWFDNDYPGEKVIFRLLIVPMITIGSLSFLVNDIVRSTTLIPEEASTWVVVAVFIFLVALAFLSSKTSRK